MAGADIDSLTAYRRFGLGPRQGDLARVKDDPRGAVAADLADPGALVVRDPALAPSAELMTSYERMRAADFEMRQAFIKRLREADAVKASARAALAPGAAGDGDMAGGMDMSESMMSERMPGNDMAMNGRQALPSAPPLGDGPVFMRATYEGEMAARLVHQDGVSLGYAERLVMFWSNHFCVNAADSTALRTITGAFEREAIRPFVLGRFADMLLAVEQHPAMLMYLDNVRSIGPNSPVGKSIKRGLNENLARETLELHTLGVGGGYSQADVTSLARIITGWTVAPPKGQPGSGAFTFDPKRHEPGDHRLLGRTFAEGGVQQGEAALAMLARHPATAAHIARKLAIHFVSDTPPPALVEKLERRFRDTDGDLRAVALTLAGAPEAWAPEASKMRLPLEFLIASRRLTGQPERATTAYNLGAMLGQPLWRPPSPEGFSDRTEEWLSPEGMTTRLDIAQRIGQSAATLDAKELVVQAFGASVSPETVQAVRRAESRTQAIALLLMSPEFQRR